MKKLIVLILLLIPGVCFSGDYDRWALVDKGQIVKFKTVAANDTVITPKLINHGYLIVIEDKLPAYDLTTQRLVDGYRVEATQVVRFYSVSEKPFPEAKEAKIAKQKAIILDKISELLDLNITGDKIEPTVSKLRTVLTIIETKNNNTELREVPDVSLSIAIE